MLKISLMIFSNEASAFEPRLIMSENKPHKIPKFIISFAHLLPLYIAKYNPNEVTNNPSDKNNVNRSFDSYITIIIPNNSIIPKIINIVCTFLREYSDLSLNFRYVLFSYIVSELKSLQKNITLLLSRPFLQYNSLSFVYNLCIQVLQICESFC